MINDRVIVDGSNLATEGRSLPSLHQLDEAVRSFLEDNPGKQITVVVDATFGHRIEPKEKPAFEEGVLAGELVTPPAGAIGRGDAFVLNIADRADASVLSNDSFQEFHGEYPWLFDEGRLIGGKPVPEVGWVFVLRAPVRGPASRRSQRTVRSGRRGSSSDSPPARASRPARSGAKVGEPPHPPPAPAGRKRKAAKASSASKPSAAPTTRKAAASSARVSGRRAAATDGDGDGSRGGRRRRAGGGTKAVEPVNEPASFLSFVSAHPVGSVVEATVDRFSSHGAYVVVDTAHCYVPLRSMSEPPPRSAREVLTVGETRSFVVESFDTPRRSIDLAIPGHEHPGDAASAADPANQASAEEATDMAAAKKTTARKAAAKKKAPTRKKAAAKKAPTRKKAAAKKAPARKAAAKKASARKAPARKKAAAKKAPAKKKAAAKKASARKAPARKKAAAKKAPAKKKAAAKKTGAKKTGARKAPARRVAKR